MMQVVMAADNRALRGLVTFLTVPGDIAAAKMCMRRIRWRTGMNVRGASSVCIWLHVLGYKRLAYWHL